MGIFEDFPNKVWVLVSPYILPHVTGLCLFGDGIDLRFLCLGKQAQAG